MNLYTTLGESKEKGIWASECRGKLQEGVREKYGEYSCLLRFVIKTKRQPREWKKTLASDATD